MYLPQDIIAAKRDGKVLQPDQIKKFVLGSVSGEVDDTQVAALCMAIVLNGFNVKETVAMTQAMADSGSKLNWETLDLDGPVLDKHSSGGVGDKVSLMVCPIIAACGGYAGKMSGRGLGHTGGTVDKMEAIPGYKTAIKTDDFYQIVKEVGCALIGQTESFAPADKKFYAIRDVTATVEHIGLITASIVSKKLAVNSNGFVGDIKVGSGAMMKTMEDAKALAKSIFDTANGAGLPTNILISDMNQVLGNTAGNALEVREAVEFLRGDKQEERLRDVTYAAIKQMLILGKLARDGKEAEKMIERVVANGQAAEKFDQMVHALGGPADFIDNYDTHLEKAPIEVDVLAQGSGSISEIDTKLLGQAVVALGGGRTKPGAAIDHSVGLTNILGLGKTVEVGKTSLLKIHAKDQTDADQATEMVHKAFRFSSRTVAPNPIIYQVIT